MQSVQAIIDDRKPAHIERHILSHIVVANSFLVSQLELSKNQLSPK